MERPKVVSLLPSATEIVARLGAGRSLVGRSQDCDYPPWVRALPVVMRARTSYDRCGSEEIDLMVRDARAARESLYELDPDALESLQPDVILTQDLCGVCSVTGAEVRQACADASIDPVIVSLDPRRLGEVWSSIEQVGIAVGREGAAKSLLHELEARTRPPSCFDRGRVAILEWLSPPILAGLWVPDMAAAAGAIAVGPAAGSPGLRTTWNRLGVETFDLVILSPCSFDVRRTLGEVNAPPLAAKLQDIRPSRGTWLADEAFFSRPGPRLAEGVELIRRLLTGQSAQDLPMTVLPWSDYAAPSVGA